MGLYQQLAPLPAPAGDSSIRSSRLLSQPMWKRSPISYDWLAVSFCLFIFLPMGQVNAQSDDCYGKGCPTGEICQNSACVVDPCREKTCGVGEYCRWGICVKACGCLRCKANEHCIDGKCQPNPCTGVQCSKGYLCNPSTSLCVPDMCQQVTCGPLRVCRQGKCVDDPCANIQCLPKQTCRDGQCIGSQCPKPEPPPEKVMDEAEPSSPPEPDAAPQEREPSESEPTNLREEPKSSEDKAEMVTSEYSDSNPTEPSTPEPQPDEPFVDYRGYWDAPGIAGGCRCHSASENDSLSLWLSLLWFVALLWRRDSTIS